MKAPAYWHASLGIWGSFNPRPIDSQLPRFWNAFGVDDPGKTKTLNITVEANPAHEGVDRRVAGLFARDDEGRTFLLHSGRIGGGRKGIGPELFWRHWRSFGGITDWVLDGDNGKEFAIVAEVGAPTAAAQIASFVQHVALMKGAKNGTAAGPRQQKLRTSFTDETEQPSVYVRQGRVETKANHGPVANALKREIESRNLRYGNDEKRDGYILSSSGELLVLFEIKATTDTQSVYTGVGQLMMNGRATNADSKLVLVLPEGEPRRDFVRQLNELQMSLVTYSFKDNAVTFIGIKGVLGDLPSDAKRR